MNRKSSAENMDFSTKVQQLSDDVSTMRTEICQMRENAMQQNEVIINLIQEQNDFIKKLLSGGETEERRTNLDKIIPKFPIQTQDDLDEFEKSIDDTNKEELISFLKPLLMPLGLKKNLKYVLSTDIVIDYNVDGSHGKLRLLGYPKLLNLLYCATEREGWSYRLFMDDLRMGLQYSKKRYFKRKSVLKKHKQKKRKAELTLNSTTGEIKNPIESEYEEESISQSESESA